MNKYNGITGKYEKIPEPETYVFNLSAQGTGEENEVLRKPSGQSDMFGGLGGILDGLGDKQGGGLGDIIGALGAKQGGLGSLLSGFGGGQGGVLGGLLSKFTKFDFEVEDIMLVAVLYLLYRESKDIEFLYIAGAMLFL